MDSTEDDILIYYIANSIFHWFRQSIIQSLLFCYLVMAYFFIQHYFVVLIFGVFHLLFPILRPGITKKKTAAQRKITIR